VLIEEKAAKISLFFIDLDGVLTDGRIVLDHHGQEIKSFHVRDGLGLKMLMKAGIEVVIVTGRRSHAAEHRARDLGIGELYQDVPDKGALCKRLIRDRGIEKFSVGCMGDDIPDLAMFREAGLSVAVADAVKEVREAADFITKRKGGHGAVREACEWILKCQEKWEDSLADFTVK